MFNIETQIKKGPDSKVCTICSKEYFRDPYECNKNWRVRKTCGGYECRAERRRIKTKEKK